MVAIYESGQATSQPQEESRDKPREHDAQDVFLAMLAHELRNPLTPLVAGIELIDQREDPALAVPVAAMKRQLAHLIRLVEDLLDVARVTSGTIRLERQHVQIGTVVEQAIALVQPILAERHHQLTVGLQGDTVVEGDPVRLTQVVANLLTNSAQYTQPRGTIEIRCLTADGRVSIAVADNGRGICRTEQSGVFALFRRGRGCEGGLGVGLTLARQLVELHGGSLTVHSEGPDAGSEFRVTLPALEVETEPDIPDAEAVPARACGCSHVVLIEDNDDVRVLTCDLLTTWGYHVESACSGRAGIDLVIAVRPDVVVVDIGLPDVDGYTVAREIRERLAGALPRLVALTGCTQPHDRRRAAEAGFHEHIAKPAHPSRLRSALAAGKP